MSILGILCRNLKLNDKYALDIVRGYRKMYPVLPKPAKTLQEQLEELNYKDPTIYYNVDIGLPPPDIKDKMDLSKKLKYLRNLKTNKEIELAARNLKLDVDLDEVSKEWLKYDGPEDISKIANHYSIYSDLFGEAYFIPYVKLEIGFPLHDEYEAPVYRGNVVKPQEAELEPNVRYESDDSTLWTLVLTNPDGHLTEENMEYVHWFVGNIPGNNVAKGEVVWDYLQPFPPRGVGFQRFIFILYKQDRKIDYTSIKGKLPRLELKDRSFNTLEFYKERQDYLTPAGLAFFQSDWDISVIKTFHEKLNMDEPIFEYDHDQPIIKPQEWFPKKQAFDLYIDKYRDPRDIAKAYLLKKSEKLNPFERPKKPFPYPNIHHVGKEVPSWLRTRMKRDVLGLGRAADQKEEEYE